MKLRIKYIENIGYFGQVSHGFFTGWRTIGKHVNGYGLYPNNHIEYPMNTDHEALELCKLYEQWSCHAAQEATYFYI